MSIFYFFSSFYDNHCIYDRLPPGLYGSNLLYDSLKQEDLTPDDFMYGVAIGILLRIIDTCILVRIAVAVTQCGRVCKVWLQW